MTDKIAILLTGGCGYIGSHICYEILESNLDLEIIIVDNLVNSTNDSIKRIKDKFNCNNISIYNYDLRDVDKMENVFNLHKNIKYIIHLGGHKSVKKSIQDPLEYYDNNLISTIVLLRMIKKFNSNVEFIFSSSATVYGNPDKLPLTENSPLGPINSYGRTKLMIEEILKDYALVNNSFKLTILRYFNPIGAHPSGLIGENPNGIPENLVPYIMKVISNQLPILNIYGNDYSTPDGTCIRDYLHVVDLAKAHLCAFNRKQGNNMEIYNIGTGIGYSVLDIIKQFEKLNLSVKYQFVDRRNGDSKEIYTDVSKAKNELNWIAKYDLSEMCRDSWNWWQNKTPDETKNYIFSTFIVENMH